MAKTKIGSLFASIALDTRGLRTGINKATRMLSGFGSNLQTVGRNIGMGIGLPLTALGATSVKTFAGFEQSMAKVRAVSGATAKEFSELSKVAKDLGASTRFTATQVSGLQLNFSKLGLNPDQINAVTEATLDLALATGEDLAESARVGASTMKGFGLEAKDMTRITDVMAKSFSSSALDLEKFAVSMRNAQVMARLAGMSIEETTAMVATLVDTGQDASKAGTDIRMIFIKLAQEGLTLGEAFERVNNSADQLSTAVELVGARAGGSLVTLAGNIPKLRELTKEFNNAEGSAKEMADIMDNTLEGAFFRLQSAVQSVQISMGELANKHLTPLINKFAIFIQANNEAIGQMFMQASVVGVLTVAFSGLLFVVGALSASLASIGSLVALALTPMGLKIMAITVAIGVLIGAIFQSNVQLHGVKDTMIGLFNGIEKTVHALHLLGQGLITIGKVAYHTFIAMISLLTPFWRATMEIGKLLIELPSLLTSQTARDNFIQAGKDLGKALTEGLTFSDYQKATADLAVVLKEDFEKMGKITGKLFGESSSEEMVDTTIETMKKLKENMQNIFAEMNDKGGSVEGGNNGFFSQLAKQGKKAFASLAENADVQLSEVESIVNRASDNMTTALQKFFNTGKMDMKDFVRSILIDLQKLMIQKTITNPLMNAIGGAIFGGATSSVGNIGMTDLPTIDGFARNGGSVQAGGTYMVGEAGAELFVPRTSGTIIPNHKLGGAGGVTVNFNVQATDANSFDSQLAQRSNMIIGMIDQAFNRRSRVGINS